MISAYQPSKKLFFIDDDDRILRYEKALLERSGYAVLVVASAQQGLRFVTMCNCDAVLIDYEMPKMNGHEVAIEIKRLRPELMVILLFDNEVPMHPLALVDAYVPTVRASRHLVQMIAELCSRSRDGLRNQGGFQQEDRR